MALSTWLCVYYATGHIEFSTNALQCMHGFCIHRILTCSASVWLDGCLVGWVGGGLALMIHLANLFHQISQRMIWLWVTVGDCYWGTVLQRIRRRRREEKKAVMLWRSVMYEVADLYLGPARSCWRSYGGVKLIQYLCLMVHSLLIVGLKVRWSSRS